jgi:FAD/FMN-containing dehydrogenase
VTHDEIVDHIQDRVRSLVGRGLPVHIHKGGVHHVVPLPGDDRFASEPIDISPLRRLISIDKDKKLAVAEPGLTFGELVEATLKEGLLPKVVPELVGITVGGAVAGCSVESMSWRYGGFHDTCRSYEIVDGTGTRRVVSPTERPDLFHMVHGSYGTLAILTKLELELVSAKPYVHLEYRKLDSFAAFEKEMHARLAAGDYELIDGIIHDPRTFVLVLGNFADTAPPERLSSYRWLEIFYKATRAKKEDWLTTADYCFRYDTECHWLTRTVPPLEWKPVRFAVGKMFLGSTNLIKWSNRLGAVLKRVKKRPDVVVDVFIPSTRFAEFFAWYEQTFDYWPLWIVPYKIPTPYPWISDGHQRAMNDSLFIDCAVYGKKNGESGVDYSQLLEEKTYELGGIKTLISRNHYEEQRFWEVYDRPRYRRAKEELDPKGVFKDLFAKFGKV